jgi:hypothetical protein
MRQTLALHPDSRCSPVTRVDVEAWRHDGGLVLRYGVKGRIKDLRLPRRAAPERADELWRHTCFETFVRPDLRTGYYEFNFAPSTQWAAYAFTSYRSGMRVAGDIDRPLIETQSTDESYVLLASLDLKWVPDLPKNGPWRLGLSAVIEEASGALSYWALSHPPGRADFHHSDCFALELAPA